MMKSSINELQGMMGGELGQSMQQLRQSAASGEGQMRATLDLAKEMGSGISRQQEARKRSEERRVGKECRSGVSADDLKKAVVRGMEGDGSVHVCIDSSE